MKILESAENYLERIYMLKQKNGQVRSIDIARALNFSKASVSIAMKQLREHAYIIVDQDGLIELTQKGEQIAILIYERHSVLTKMLIGLGVSAEIAREDACRIEHVISEETFSKIKLHLAQKGSRIDNN